MAAGERDGAGQQAHQRVEAQQPCHPDAEGILQQQQPHHHDQERPHNFTARPQAGEVGIQANGRKKGQHQRVFQAHIEINFPAHAFFQHQQRKRHQQAAGNGLRDSIFFQEGDGVDELSAQQQHQRGGNERR